MTAFNTAESSVAKSPVPAPIHIAVVCPEPPPRRPTPDPDDNDDDDNIHLRENADVHQQHQREERPVSDTNRVDPGKKGLQDLPEWRERGAQCIRRERVRFSICVRVVGPPRAVLEGR